MDSIELQPVQWSGNLDNNNLRAENTSKQQMTSGNKPRLTTNDAAEEGNPLLSPEQVPVDNGGQHRIDGEEVNQELISLNVQNSTANKEMVPVDNGGQHRIDGEEVNQELISLNVQNSTANKEMTCMEHRRLRMFLCLLFLVLLVIGVSFAVCLGIHDDVDERYDPALFKLPRYFNGSFRLTNQIFIPELLSPASNQSKTLSSQLKKKLSELYSSSPALGRYFSSAGISDFRNSSVVADYWLRFLMPLNDAELEQFTLSREMVYNVFRQSLYDQDPELNHPLYIHPASLDMQVGPATGESSSGALYW